MCVSQESRDMKQSLYQYFFFLLWAGLFESPCWLLVYHFVFFLSLWLISVHDGHFCIHTDLFTCLSVCSNQSVYLIGYINLYTYICLFILSLSSVTSFLYYLLIYHFHIIYFSTFIYLSLLSSVFTFIYSLIYYSLTFLHVFSISNVVVSLFMYSIFFYFAPLYEWTRLLVSHQVCRWWWWRRWCRGSKMRERGAICCLAAAGGG